MAEIQRLKYEPRLLAGDIGATKTNLALFSSGQPLRDFNNAVTLAGDEYPGVLKALQYYFESRSVDAGFACFGVAGPVIGRRVHMINLDWVIDAGELEKILGFERVWLLNDLEATAQAVPILEDNEVAVLNPGVANPTSVIGVIAPGTGLGMAFLTHTDLGYQAHATEGGHTDFAPTDELQEELLHYLRPRMEHVSLEAVCSGVGLPSIYAFLRDSGRGEETAALRQELASAEDPTPVIVEAATRKKPPVPICAQALQVFVDVLAAAVSNLALVTGAMGGVYIGGGIPPRILSYLEQPRFLDRYLNKAGYEDYLRRVPINVILNTNAALLGAADYGLKRIAELS